MVQSIDIKGLRASLGITQVQLAEMVGVDQSTVSNWENGGTTPRGPAIKLLERLSRRPSPKRTANGRAA